MNPDLNLLQDYPFTRLRHLLTGINTPQEKTAINLSIGEPKHAAPDFVLKSFADNLSSCSVYPSTLGMTALRETIAKWLEQRFHLNTGIDPATQVIPVNGTREALFAFAQSCIDRTQKKPLVLSPNPFYQIYEGATLLAGAQPHLLACTKENKYLADFSSVPPSVWQNCQLIYICTPGNPSGSVIPLEQLQQLIALAQQYNFIIASDECYSEIYADAPPIGLLQACATLGIADYKNCVVFHSLSKRSNLPGLRSGFVAGDAKILQRFLQYRTYHGCAMSEAVQHASISAWADETHVMQNRLHYFEKFTALHPILSEVTQFNIPDAGFYIWLPTKISDTEFATQLFSEDHVTVLPGSFLSRDVDGCNPGAYHVRIALVAEKHSCIEAAQRIKSFILRHQLALL